MDIAIQIIIAGLGVIVACLQIKISLQINEQSISREKGYFMAELTNLRNPQDNDYNRFIGDFYLDRPIKCDLCGNCDTFIIQKMIKVNGKVRENKDMLETFFSQYSKNLSLGIELPLSDKELTSNRIDIEIIFSMKNTSGYKYLEIMSMKFVRKKEETIWFQEKSNIRFEKYYKIKTML